MGIELIHIVLTPVMQDKEVFEDLGPLLEPNPVAFSFDTLGWKISFGFFLFSLLIWSAFVLRNFVRNKYRRMALNVLASGINTSLDNNIKKVNFANTILKKIAIEVYGRPTVAGMSGSSWLAFLDSKCGASNLSLLESIFNSASFNLKEISDVELVLVLNQTKKWIKHHAR